MGRNCRKKGQEEKWIEKDIITPTCIQAVKVAKITAYRAAKHSQIPRVRCELMSQGQ